MAYTPTNWKAGDVITSEKLNKLENGVADAGGVLAVGFSPESTETTIILDKTWAEINAAAFPVISSTGGENIKMIAQIVNVYPVGDFRYSVDVVMWSADTPMFANFVTDSEDGYPTHNFAD